MGIPIPSSPSHCRRIPGYVQLDLELNAQTVNFQGSNFRPLVHPRSTFALWEMTTWISEDKVNLN